MTAHTITMRSGKISAGRPALAAAFLALLDGDYTVRILPNGVAMERILGIVEWYNSLGEQQMLDPALLHHLLPNAATLALLLSNMTAEVNEMDKASEGADLRLEIERGRLLAEAQVSAETSTKKFSVSAAMVSIGPQIAPLLTAKSETQQAYRAANRLLSAFGKVLDRMNQQIAMLRSTAEHERRAGGR